MILMRFPYHVNTCIALPCPPTRSTCLSFVSDTNGPGKLPSLNSISFPNIFVSCCTDISVTSYCITGLKKVICRFDMSKLTLRNHTWASSRHVTIVALNAADYNSPCLNVPDALGNILQRLKRKPSRRSS